MNLSFYQKTAFAGLALFMLASFFSVGYHHPDEHFQIIEFCNYKLGHSPATDLSWEFNAQIRPALPVFICYGIFSFFDFFGITDPFILALILRVITGLAAWYIIRRTALVVLPDFKTEGGKKIFFVLLFLLWFMPYLSVRFSSENLSAIAFLFSVCFILTNITRDSGKKYPVLFLAGFLLGLSFYFRFQMGFAIVGLGLWLLFIQKVKFYPLLWILLGGILSLTLCILTDYWFYGEWVLSPLNYFDSNILEDVASGWGVSPWWNYFYLSFMQAAPPIGLALLIFFFWGSSKKLKHIFVWTLVPFLIAHFMVGHKEMRFMFPMLFAVLYLASIGIDHLIATGKMRRAAHITFVVLLAFNSLLLVFRTLAPARELIYYYRFLYAYTAEKKIELVCLEEDLYLPAQLPINFYKSPNVTTRTLTDETAFQQYLVNEKPQQVYLLERKGGQKILYPGYSQKTIYTYFPDWLTDININDWTSHAKIWKIKELKRQ